MPFLPVVQRELSVAGRRTGTYWARVASASIALIVFGSFVLMDRTPPAMLGSRILAVLAIFIFLECIIAGIRYTCDCISEERREGTLGLLFLTGLNGWDVVLGKMVSRSIGSVYNLLAVIPIFALPLLLGGVTGAQFLALICSFLIALFFSLSAGIFISNRSTGEREVIFRTLRLVAALTLVPPIIHAAVTRFTGAWITFEPILYLSPAYAFREAGRGFTPEFTESAIVLLGLSLAMLTHAACTIRSSKVQAESLPTTPIPPRPPLDLVGRAMRNFNPALWLALRRRSQGYPLLFLCLGVVAFGIFCRIAIIADWNWLIPFVVFGSYGVHAVYKFILVAETARQLTHDRRSGALELLLSTPLPPEALVRSQLTATRTLWLPLGGCVALMNLLWMTDGEFLEDVGIFLPVSLMLLWVDSITLPTLALRNALQGWRYLRVVFQTYLRVMAPPILAFVLILLLGESGGMSQNQMLSWVFFWSIAAAIYDGFILHRSRRDLKDFRNLAACGEARSSSSKNRSSWIRRASPSPAFATTAPPAH